MQLPLPELEQLFRLHRTLMFFVNQRLKVIPNELADPEEFAALEPNLRVQVRDAFLNHRELIDAFAKENPGIFPRRNWPSSDPGDTWFSVSLWCSGN